MRLLMWIEAFGQDFRYAVRMLGRNRAFTAAAVLSLALGIGATTMVFSALYGIVIEPFPYKEPDRLMSLNIRNDSGMFVWSSYQIDDYLDLEANTHVFSGVIVSTISDVLMTGTGEPERLRGNYISMNTFEVMGATPILGRGTLPDDSAPGASPIAVLSYNFWQRRFGGDRNVIGQQLRLNGTIRTIVGVMPPRFLWRGADVYLPIPFRRGEPVDDVRTLHLMGRLKPGVSNAQAETDVRPVIQDIRQRKPQVYGEGGYRLELRSFKDTFASPLRSALLLLLGAVALLLLIACGNVSNLLLARTSARTREIAVRTSLGASRGRVIRQLLTESLVLAAFGGILGVALAYGSLEALLLIIPPDMIPAESEITLNRQVLVFTLIVSMLSAIVFGLAPAMQSAKTGLVTALRESGRGLAGGFRQARLRSTLIVLEVALSVVLLVAASLMIRTVMRMQQVALGFEPDRILSMRIPLPPQRYPKPEDRARFFANLLERTRALPGVTDVAASSSQPLYVSRGTLVDVPGRPFDNTRGVGVTEASERFLQISGTQLLRGRAFDAADVNAVRHVGVINETFARTYFGTNDPIGLIVHLKYLQRPPLALADDAIEIIGVAKDQPNLDIDRQMFPHILIPYTLNGSSLYLLARTSLPPLQLDRSIRAQVYGIDKDQPVAEVRAMNTLIDQWSFSAPRFNLVLFAIFALLGLLLATIGVYGVISYSVVRQTQEIGVRMALGAQKTDILRMVLAMGLKLVIAGLVIGCIAAYAASTLLASQLRGVSPHDPVAFISVVAVLLFVGIQACLWPARRAARIDPMVALRYE
jgi:putative ABC transport system permease protein